MSTFVLAVEAGREMSAVRAELKTSGVRIKHRLGNRYLVVETDRPLGKLPAGVSQVDDSPRPPVGISKSADGSELALAAWRARHAPGRLIVKENRPFDGASWDGPGAPPDDPRNAAGIGNVSVQGLLDRRPRVRSVPPVLTEAAKLEPSSAAAAVAAPVAPERLINDVAVGLVFVDAPNGSEFGMTATEIVDATAEVQDGLDWLGDQRPEAEITWSIDVRTVAVDIDPFEGSRWPGLPIDWYGGVDGTGTKGIDSAVWRSSNGAIYFFRGAEYVRFSNVADGVDPGYPAPIAGNWVGLPASFTSGIDASFWRESNDKIYFFKGNQYARIEPSNATMDAGYPKPIAGNWVGVPADFAAGIDAALMRRDNHKIYFFKGDEYVRIDGETSEMDSGYPAPIANNWKGMPDAFNEGIDAALWRESNDKIYLFKDGDYVRFTGVADGVDDGYPQPIGLTTTELELAWREVALAAMGYASGDQLSEYVNDLEAEYSADTAYATFVTRWPVGWIGYAGFPRIVMHYDLGNWGPTNMDRVMAHETGHIFGAPDEYASSNCSCSTKAGRFFSVANANCANCDDGGTPCLMNVNSYEFCSFTPLHFGWGAFMERVDAAMWRGSNDKVYLFGGNYYLRYTDVADGRDSGYPAPIAGNWKDIPLSYWDGFDAALWRESNGKIYFFNGDSYIRIDGVTSTMDPGYPLPIAGKLAGAPGGVQ